MNEYFSNQDKLDWQTVQALFDQLAGLPETQRQKKLAELNTLTQRQFIWLRAMLAADGQHHGLLDNPEESLAELLPPADGSDQGLPGTQDPKRWINRQVGAYRIVEFLGHGGMSLVFLAERADQRFEKQVAIKLICNDQRQIKQQELLKEARILARLQHPNIAQLLDAGVTDEDTPFIIMEFCDGQQLLHYVSQNRLTIPQRLKLFLSLCNVVQYAHNRLVVHRDIKPGNILVLPDATLKLLDFGIGGLLEKQRQDSVPGWITPEYAAPEQFNRQPPSVAGDVYALGILLYELLCGVRPFVADVDSRFETLQYLQDKKLSNDFILPSVMVLNRPVTSADDQLTQSDSRTLSRALSGDLDAIVECALQADVNRRYQSAKALAEDIENHLQHRPISMRRDNRWHNGQLWLRRNAWLATGLCVVLISMLSGLSFSLWQAKRATDNARLAQDNATRAEAVQSFLEDMFISVDPEFNQQSPVLLNDLVDQQARHVNTAFAAQPDIKIELLNTLGKVQISLGNFSQAIDIFNQRLALQQTLGADATETAESYLHLGAAWHSYAGATAALEMYNKGLALLDEKFTLVKIQLELKRIIALQVNREYEKADAILARLGDYKTDLFSSDQGKSLYADLLIESSRKQARLGQFDAAEKTLELAQEVKQQVLPASHSDWLNHYEKLSDIYRYSSQFERLLETDFELSLKSREIYSDLHISTLSKDLRLVATLLPMQCYVPAHRLGLSILDRYQQVFGKDNFYSNEALNTVIVIERRLGLHSEALAKTQRSLDYISKDQNSRQDTALFVKSTQALLLVELDELAQLAAILPELRRDIQKFMQTTAAKTNFMLLSTYAELMAKTQNYKDAITYYRLIYDLVLQRGATNSRYAINLGKKLVWVYQAAGQTELAWQLMQRHQLRQDQIDSVFTPERLVDTNCRLPVSIDLQRLGI